MIKKTNSIKHSYAAITLGIGLLLISTLITMLISYNISREFTSILKHQVQIERHTKDANFFFKRQVQEWKNLLLRGHNEADQQYYWRAFKSNEQQLTQEIHAILALNPRPEVDITIKHFLREHAALGAKYRQARQAFLTSDKNPHIADQQVRGIDRLPSELLSTLASQVAIDAENAAQKLNQRTQDNVLFSALSITIMFILILFMINRVVSRAISSEIRSKTKSDFLAKMSHEIRTPMNGVLGMAELMGSTELSAVQRRYNDAIQSSGTALVGIINDLLDFSKIEAGKLVLEDINYCPRQLLEDIYYLFAYTAKKKGVDLIFNVDMDVPDTLRGDPGRLRQVILNLVGNAIKFTQQGHIHVHVSLSEDAKPQLQLSIADTGEGMDSEQLETVFQPFTQANASVTRRFGGTGLGLSIAQEIINRMGGKMTVHSELDQGTQFHLFLPLHTVSPYRISTQSLQQVKLLIVDDSDIFAELYTQKCQQWGMQVTCIQDASHVIDHLEKKPDYDLLCLDYHMPSIDGLALAKHIRALKHYADTPIALLTATGSLPSDASLADNGITHAEEKPALPDHLIHLFERLLNGEKPTGHTRSINPQTASLQALNILVAEDNAVNGMVVRGMLQQIGHTVTIVEDGQQAVDSYLSSHEHFDIILMDCEMPNLDGYGAAQKIRSIERADSQRKRVHILALTAHAAAEEKQKCITAGMDNVLTKPISQQRLKEAIKLQAGC